MAPAAILLVDNASTDGSVALVRAQFREVEIISMPSNDGPGPARNRGMEAARTSFVFAVDCDVTLERDCLATLLAAMDADRTLTAVEPRGVAAEAPGVVQYDGAWFHYVGLLSLRNFYVPLERATGRGVVDIDAFISLAVLADREALLKAGGYDPTFFILFEDSDLSYRIRSSGGRIAAVCDARITHHGGTAGTSFRSGLYPARRVFLHSRNRWLFILKNYEWLTVLRGLPGLIIYEVVAIVFAFIKLAPHAYISGKIAFFRSFGPALASRARTRERRRIRDVTFIRGGPLTLWPPLTAGPATRALGESLSFVLRFLWFCTGGRP